MMALSRGLISCLRVLTINSTTLTATTTLSSHQFLRAFGSEVLADDASAQIIEAKSKIMTPNSKRTGLIALKCGMTALWDKWGARIPITVLWVDDNIVTKVNTPETDNIYSLQVRSCYLAQCVIYILLLCGFC